MNKKLILISILIGVMFIIPMISAATTMTAPVTKGNYTKSLAVAVTVDPNGANNMTNVTCYSNSSGGAATVQFLQILNTTLSQTSFTGTGTLTTEATTYNITCQVYNMTTLNKTLSATGITIDGTNPTASVTVDTTSPNTRGTVNVVWSSSDATSGVKTVTTTVTSPDTTRCATKTYTDTSKTIALTGEDTKCTGTYTILETVTDFSGNSATSSKTFKTFDSGLSKSGSNTLGGSSKSKFTEGKEINSNPDLPLGETGTNIAIFALIGLGLWYFFKKK